MTVERLANSPPPTRPPVSGAYWFSSQKPADRPPPRSSRPRKPRRFGETPLLPSVRADVLPTLARVTFRSMTPKTVTFDSAFARQWQVRASVVRSARFITLSPNCRLSVVRVTQHQAAFAV